MNSEDFFKTRPVLAEWLNIGGDPDDSPIHGCIADLKVAIANIQMAKSDFMAEYSEELDQATAILAAVVLFQKDVYNELKACTDERS